MYIKLKEMGLISGFFQDQDCRVLFLVIEKLVNNSKEINEINITYILEQKKLLKSEIQIIINTGFRGVEKYYEEKTKDILNIMRESYLKKKVSDFFYEKIKKIDNESYDEIMNSINFLKESLKKDENPDYNVIDLSKMLNVYKERIENDKDGKINGVKTGIKPLDERVGMLNNGTINIIAGRSGHGKTFFTQEIAYNVAKNGKSVLYISSDMPPNVFLDRMFSFKSGIPDNDLRLGKYGKDKKTYNNLKLQVKKFQEDVGHNLIINQKSVSDINKISTIVRNAQINQNIALVVIDYLQELEDSNLRKESEYHKMTYIITRLKNLAKDTDIPFLIISQISRKETEDVAKESIRGSGHIEEKSDLIVGLYKPNQDTPNINCTILKRRNYTSLPSKFTVFIDGDNKRIST